MSRSVILVLALVAGLFASGQERRPLSSDSFITIRGGLRHVARRLAAHEPVTVAFLGGSITYNPGWRDKTMQWLQERYPEVSFHFIAAGIPSLGSPAHAFRLQRDVLDSGRVDLLFVEAAVNDRVNGVDSVTQGRSLFGIVRHALKINPEMDLVFMAFADELKIADLRAGKMPTEVRVQERVARACNVASIDLAREVRERIDNGEFRWKEDFKDLHPSPFGQEVYFKTIRTLLERCLLRGEADIPHDLRGAAVPKYPFDNGKYVEPATVAAPAGWTLVRDWSPADGKGTRPGFVHVPVLETATAEAPLVFSFNGTAVGINVTAGPDAGIVAWQIDGGPERQLDLFTQWSKGLYLPWYCILGQGLQPGKHLLRLHVLAGKNSASEGTVCRIVHFLVNE